MDEKRQKDRERAEALNSDHHRRMTLESQRNRPAIENKASGDERSREAIVTAMLGCAHRHKMEADGKQLLEIGAGYAGDQPYLEQRMGIWYTGIELVREVADQTEGVHYMALEDAPESWYGTFGYIYSRHVMEHMLDPWLALQAVKKLLAPNGIVGAVTPHYFPDPEPAHVTQLKISEWMNLYQRVGLKPVYAVTDHYACEEAHIVAVHADWPLQP